MKKLLIFVVAIITLLSFTACEFNKPVVEENGKVTVVIMEEQPLVYELILEELDLTDGALSLLLYLRDNKGLDVQYQNSEYGAYLTKVGAIKTDEAGYVSLFTSYESDWDVTSWAIEKDYEGTKIVSAGVGISSMSIVDGVIIYITYVKF